MFKSGGASNSVVTRNQGLQSGFNLEPVCIENGFIFNPVFLFDAEIAKLAYIDIGLK